MEVEEETTSNHFEESIPAETTTVINEILVENTTSIDKQSEKEQPELVPESTSQEKEDSSISVPKPEGSEAFVSVAVEEEVEEIVHCLNSESVAALSDGVENSDMVESMNVVQDSKDGDDGTVKEIDAPSDDVAAVECGGSELTCSDKVDGGVGMEAVAEEKCDLDAVDENVENDGEHNNVGEVVVIEKNENEGDEILIPEGQPEDEKETVKEEESVEVLKGDDEGGVVLSPVVHNGEGDEFTDDQSKNDGALNVQLEDAVDVQEMVGSDDRNDGGGDAQVENIDNLQVNEEEPAVTEDVKEEEMVPDEEEAVGVTEDFKEESLMANEETADAVAEKEEEETMAEDQDQDEEKSLDTEMETDKSVDTDIDTEKSLDIEMETEEEANVADQEKVQEDIETESELPESSQNSSGGKRKRGGKNTSKSSVRKTIEEDVCFICFDGGDLVLCDRRNCPKAYHPSCVNRDEAFFQSKGSWNCGWHLCSICEKKAEYMCYTCTYSVCKSCIKTSDMLCVREKEKKGLCEACMRTVMLIENPENQENVNFEDENSWEHLFKDYWTETKAKHDLSLPELLQAKKQESLQSDTKDEGNSDNPPENPTTRKTRRQTRKQKSYALTDDNNTEWVSKELLDLITHMKNGDSSVISQYEVQDLLLEYIKRNKLRDPNKKSQIICDTRLEAIFGKPRVAHIEMLKLLESHFLAKEDSSQVDDFQGSVVDDDESNEKDHKDKKRKGKKKGDKKGPQSNREDYAAIDIHNISLIYLKRKLVEDLLDDVGSFGGKIVGTFVRIRISGANQKQDIYRLVQVTGTSEAAQYTLGKRTTSIMLEILNLDKTEIIPIDTISNQEFTEDECKRLRQSIKCGLISRLTVGDILDKAMELQVARVNDWVETETVRLSHLRDRASDLGRKKELRECVEKLNVLKMPEERARKLDEIPLIHDDPTMDPQYESEDDNTNSDDNKQDLYKRSDSFRFNKRGRDQFSPRGDYNSNSNSKESWSGTPRKNYEYTRNPSNRNLPVKTEDTTTSSYDMHIETSHSHSHSHSRDPHVQQQTPIKSEKPTNLVINRETPVVTTESIPKSNDSEKIWHYKDPSGKIQGPFSMGQLRKWSKNGYFPARLIIWKKTEKEDDGIVLTDALDGNFQKPNPTPETKQLPSPTPNKSPTNWGAVSQSPSSSVPTLVPCGSTGGTGTSVGPVAVAVTPQNPQGWNNSGGGVQVNNMQQPYNQWTGGGTMVPDPSGSFMPQPQVQPNVSWQNMQQQLPQQPQQVQVQVQPNWGTMAMSPNMMWAPAPNTGMAWGPMVQGPQVTATVDPTWVAATQVQVPGWIPQPPVPGVAPNQTWVAPNNGWVYPPQNQIQSQIQGPPGVVNSGWSQGAPGANMGWVQPVVNQGQVAAPAPAQAPVAATTPTGTGNSNQNWGGPRNNQGNWGGRNDNRGGYSGQRRNQGAGFHGGNNKRPFNKQDSARSSDR